MKKSLFISFVIFVFSFSALPIVSVVAQEQLQDVVYLKNGSIIRGMIIELIPNKSIKIKMVDNSLFVFQMDEIERMTKEPISGQTLSVSKSVSSPDKIVIGANPLGAILGGVSWISYEKYFSENLTYQFRADLWMYSETENEMGYFYEENQTGFGAGSSVRAYIASSQPYSGLFGAIGLDAVYTGWDWKERATSTSPMHTGDGNTMTVVLSAQFGFAIAISNVRIEPSIVAGNFILREKGAGVVGVFVAPAVQIGVLF
jgi:hypothetical protein